MSLGPDENLQVPNIRLQYS